MLLELELIPLIKFYILLYQFSRLTRSSFHPCLVSAVQGASRRVHEELEPSSTALKILQDIFGQFPKNTECENETEQTDLGQLDTKHSTLPD